MEGPSLVILAEEAMMFKGKKVIEATGYKLEDHDRLVGKKVLDFKTWGKHFLVCFKDFTVRIHYGLFGSYRINNPIAGRNASLSLNFSNGSLDSYIASVKILEGDLDEYYDWRLDMFSEKWKPAAVFKKLMEESPGAQVGDLLLNANIFSGVGNIIRNEVLYRARLHPESLLGNIPEEKIKEMIRETKKYSFDFLKWRKINQLSRHYEVYSREKCPAGHKVVKTYTGKTKRRSFICPCMKLYKSKMQKTSI